MKKNIFCINIHYYINVNHYGTIFQKPSVIKTKKREREIKRQEGEGHIARSSERRGGERERDRGSIFSFPAIRRKPLRHKNVPIQTAIQDIFQKLLPSMMLIVDGNSEYDARAK